MQILLRKNEVHVSSYHHHFIPFLSQCVMAFIVLIPFYILLTVAEQYIPQKILIPLKIILIFVSLIFLLHISCNYWLDKLVITNQRAIHINWKNIFSKEIHDIELSEVDYISIKDMGIMDKIPFLNYGDLYIHGTSSSVITFKDVYKPHKVQYAINKELK